MYPSAQTKEVPGVNPSAKRLPASLLAVPRWLVPAVADEFLVLDSEDDPGSRAAFAALWSAPKEDWTGKYAL